MSTGKSENWQRYVKKLNSHNKEQLFKAGQKFEVNKIWDTKL